MSFLGKEYNFCKQENCDALWRHLGFPEEDTKEESYPSEKFVKNGDSYTYYSQNPKGGPVEVTFKSGVQFDSTFDELPASSKVTFVVDGNTVTQTIKTDTYEAIFKREYNGNDMVITATATGYDGIGKMFYKA